MMRIRRLYVQRALLALAVLVAPTLASAQGRAGMKRGEGARRINSVAILIDARDDLKLTSDQLVTLDSLQKELVERNRPLTLRLAAMRDSAFGGRDVRRLSRDLTTEDREKMKGGMEAMRPILEEMRKNDAEGRVVAESVLDGNQKLVARDLLAKRQEEMRARMEKGRGRVGRQPARPRCLRVALGGGRHELPATRRSDMFQSRLTSGSERLPRSSDLELRVDGSRWSSEKRPQHLPAWVSSRAAMRDFGHGTVAGRHSARISEPRPCPFRSAHPCVPPLAAPKTPLVVERWPGKRPPYR